MAETLENYSFFDKGIFHILQDALQESRLPPVRIFLICFSMKVHLTDGFSWRNVSKNNDLAWDMIHIGQAGANIMECGKVKEVYAY